MVEFKFVQKFKMATLPFQVYCPMMHANLSQIDISSQSYEGH